MTRTPAPAPAPRSDADKRLDRLFANVVAMTPNGQKVAVFVRDENVAAHYKVPVNTFVALPKDEALYMLQGRFAFSVHGPLISPGNYEEHPIAGPFVPYSGIPPAPEPAPEPPPPEPAPSPEPPPPEPAPAPATGSGLLRKRTPGK
jgi:hypothetical protein